MSLQALSWGPAGLRDASTLDLGPWASGMATSVDELGGQS